MDRLRLARIAARVLAIGGVIAGSSREVIPVQVLRHGDELVLSADLHVHGFPGDGTLPPWDLSREAARRGLDAIALTSHNNQLAWWLAGVMPSPADGVLVIHGQELTAAGYHMASMWEILDPSNLRYNTQLGATLQDSGFGPPTASASEAWIRTGGPASNSETIGLGNCNAWTSASHDDAGTLVRLDFPWDAAGEKISPWFASTIPCSVHVHVWCVQD